MATPSSLAFAAGPPAIDLPACYHCGQPCAVGASHAAVIGGASRPFCCAGCQAVAQTIEAAGLGNYYQHRLDLGAPLDDPDGEQQQRRAVYDVPEVQAAYAHPVGDALEASLQIDNLRCAACVWLCEQQLARQPGVQDVRVNYATGRARVRWDPAANGLSGILSAFAAIGYRATPFEPSLAAQSAQRERRGLLFRMAVAMLGMMQVMMYAWPVYTHEGSIDVDHLRLLQWASLALTLPVVGYSAWPLLQGAWRGLRHRRLGMDVPVVLGILAAFAASVVATVRGEGEVYYDSVTMFVALLLAARYIELRVRHDAHSGAQALTAQLPPICAVVPDYPARRGVRMAALAQVAEGDVVRVLPGEAFPVDGLVLEGDSDVDESIMTGESRPLLRQPGDAVLAGSYNCTSPVWVRAARTGGRTRLAQIVRTLDRALEDKPRMAVLADRVAVWFVAALIALAAVVGALWWWIEPARVLPIMIAVLVVSCPCALSLATPAALAAATAALARKGVLIVRGHTLETLAKVTDVVFDKTGTLTEGRFSLDEIWTSGRLGRHACLALAAELEQASSHPIAQALQRSARVAGQAASTDVSAPAYVPGSGIEAQWQGRAVRLGSKGFVAALADAAGPGPLPADADAAATTVWLGDAQGMLARFALRDTLRADTEDTLARLAGEGLRIHLVSGDDAATVACWAGRLGIERAQGGAAPEEKLAYVARLQQEGAVVLAVGDGVNDAPVLAQAQVSLALGSGTPLAQASADAVLMGEGVSGVAAARAMARRTRRVVRQNLGWALAYNLSFIPLAAVGWVSAWMAAVGMSLSSLLVVGNAWRLSR